MSATQKSGVIAQSAALLRGFAVDFLTAHDPSAARRIMDPAYRLSIGGHVFNGRDDEYLPATTAQLEQFPGLCVTVHDVVLSPGAAAMRFTEHGVSARDGRAASWGGVAMFRIAEGRLAEGWAEEDYLARKRQLKSGEVDPVVPPHAAPWDTPVRDPDPRTDRIVDDWLADSASLRGPVEEISAGGPPLAALVDPASIAVTARYSAGPRAMFHALVTGAYAGGFGESADAASATVIVPVAGLLDTADGGIVRAQICCDRLGLQRRLRPAK